MTSDTNSIPGSPRHVPFEPPVAVPRTAVFGQVLWRSLVVAIAGGAVVGAISGLVFAVVTLVVGDDAFDEVVVVPLLGAYFGGVFGLVLGVVGGLIIAAVTAIRIVPYPGEGVALLTARVTSVVVVGAFMALLFAGATGAWSAIALISALALVGAWMSGPFLVGWYVRRLTMTTVD
jgi:hypothetical protein